MVVGIVLSVVADAIISVSLNVTKYAHNINHDPATNKPKKPYIKLPLWWLGIILNAGGELGNLFAYGFAPASLVTPVGSVGVLCNAFLATCFLKEVLRRRDMAGMIAIIIGVVMIVLGVPALPDTMTVKTLQEEVLPSPRCWGYLSALCVCIFVLRILAPRYGDKHILVYLMLCSMISSITVIAARAFSSMLTSIFKGASDTEEVGDFASGEVSVTATANSDSVVDVVSAPLFWVCLVVIIITAIWSVKFLNNAMMLYGNTQVVPLYYCTFTLCSVVGAAIVYNEFRCITLKLGLVFGFGCVCAGTGVFLIASGKKPEQAESPKPDSGTSPYTTDNETPKSTRPLRKHWKDRKTISDEGFVARIDPPSPGSKSNCSCSSTPDDFTAGPQDSAASAATTTATTATAGLANATGHGDGSVDAVAKLRKERAERRKKREEEQKNASQAVNYSPGVTFTEPPADDGDSGIAVDVETPEAATDPHHADGAVTPPYIEEPTTLAELGAAVNEALLTALGFEPEVAIEAPAAAPAPPPRGRNTAAIERARKNRNERRMRANRPMTEVAMTGMPTEPGSAHV